MQIQLERPGLIVAEQLGLLAFVMQDAPGDATFDDCATHLRSALERQASVTTLTLIPHFRGRPTASRPNELAFVRLVNSYGRRHLGAAIVIGAQGLDALMVRLTVNGMALFSRAESPLRMFATLDDASRWIANLPGQLPELRNAAVVAAAVESLRRAT